MLKKLRLKFIGINMALVCLVLLIVFATLVYSTARQLEEDATAALELALRWEGRDDPRPPLPSAFPMEIRTAAAA